MKGNPEVITTLNERLVEYHTSMVQFTTHSFICGKWGYSDLADYFKHLVHESSEALGKIMERVLFLDGITSLEKLNEVDIAESMEDTLDLARLAKLTTIAGCSEGIEVCLKFKDYGTRHLLEKLIVEEDKHLSIIEAKMTQITQRGTS